MTARSYGLKLQSARLHTARSGGVGKTINHIEVMGEYEPEPPLLPYSEAYREMELKVLRRVVPGYAAGFSYAEETRILIENAEYGDSVTYSDLPQI